MAATERIAMAGLGVNADLPAVPIQPPLADGMHLRWAFARELGFPWWGFHLYRRPSLRDDKRTCLARGFLDAQRQEGTTTSVAIGPGTLSSDRPLNFTDDFPASGAPEVDLSGEREWVRFALHSIEVASVINVAIGLRAPHDCIDLRQITRTPPANPLRLGGVMLEVDYSPRKPSLIFPSLRLEDGKLEGGLRVTRDAVVHFDEPIAEAKLLVGIEGSGGQATAYSVDGKVVATAKVERHAGTRTEIRLSGERRIARIVLKPRRGWLALLQICKRGPTEKPVGVRVVAFRRTMIVASVIATGKPGEIVHVDLEADQIDRIDLLPNEGGHLPDAALVDLCYRSLTRNKGSGWRPLNECPQPLALPVFHPDYPASGNGNVDRDASEQIALSRISYGDSAERAGVPFTDLHACLLDLVDGGPGGAPMADPSRAKDLPADLLPAGSPQAPVLSAMHPIDLALLAALHPAAAQVLGLYFVDRSAQPGEHYDYLVIGDWNGTAKGDPMAALEFWLTEMAGYEGYLLPNKHIGPLVPLAPPDDLRAFSLPASGTMSALGSAGAPPVVTGLVGLRWAVPADSSGGLLPHSPVLYHLWRKELGNAADPATDPDLGDWITKHAPVLVGRPIKDPFAVRQRPADWPDLAMYRIDRVNSEGWYAYRASGMDIFGRISSPSPRFPWYQWAPPPNPVPWYYQHPPGDTVVHNEAVRVLDKTPPPPPAGVEATALDPADPFILADAAYAAWRNGLPSNVRETLVGLRVTWRWTAAQARQAPDMREFRIYYSGGGAAPRPDARDALNWEQRIHIVPYADAVTEEANGDRLYLVFLPIKNSAVFAAGLPLAPTLADPVVFAHVGVSAADSALHSRDDAKWAAGAFGNRAGNESRLGVPAKIFRVQREAPPTPVPSADSERVFATPADYHGHSYYTYRWRPLPHLRAHVLRAMDNSVFAVDRKHRPRPALTSETPEIFPGQAVEPRWDKAKRGQVAAELNALNGFANDPAGNAAAASAYRALSNDAMRVLAGLPGNEAAFVQVTVQPLDPGDPSNANRVGPDNPANFAIDPTLRCYVDTLDGRGTNRYFYRVAYIDGAQNRSAVSLSGPPVWLPNVVPPRAPVLTKARGGERQIDLTWASNREADLAAYRIYGTQDPAAAHDWRAMTPLATIAVAAGDPAARPASVIWTDTPVPGLVNRWYAVTAVDDAGNESAASRIICARAFDETLPASPTLSAKWTAATPQARAQAQVSWTSPDETRLERRVVGNLQWDPMGDWRAPGSHDEVLALDPTFSWRLRLRVRKYTGAQVIGPSVPLNQL